MSKTKNYLVNFYRCHCGPNDPLGHDFKAILSGLSNKTEYLDKSKRAGIQVTSIDNDRFFGVIKTYRSDAPHVGTPAGSERPIKMNDNEQVIEKSYFLYCGTYNISAVLISNHCRSPQTLINCLNNQNPPASLSYSHIVTGTALQRLLDNESAIKSFECAVILPTARDGAPGDNWSKSALALAEGAPGRLVFKLEGNMRGTIKEPLEPSAIQRIREGVTSGFLSKAKAVTIDDQPIDLIKDRVSARIKPIMSGRYPSPGSVRDELHRAFDELQDVLQSYKP